MTEDELLEKDPVKIAKQLQRLKGVDDDDEEHAEEVVGRRKTAYNLAISRGRNQQSINDLDVAFRRRMAKFMKNPGVYLDYRVFHIILTNSYSLLDYKGAVRRDTVAAINKRRDTIIRRQSQLNFGKNYQTTPSNGIHYDNPNYLNDTYEISNDSVI